MLGLGRGTKPFGNSRYRGNQRLVPVSLAFVLLAGSIAGVAEMAVAVEPSTSGDTSVPVTAVKASATPLPAMSKHAAG